MGELQLPLLSVDQLPFLRQIVESTSLISPPLQLSLKAYVSDPLHRIIDLF